MEELDRKLNELAHNIGMERQHKKLVKELLVELTQKCYHEGYHEGYEDNREMDADQYNKEYGLMKEKSE